MPLSGLIKELRREKDQLQRHLAGIDAALTAFAGAYTKPTRKRSASMQEFAALRVERKILIQQESHLKERWACP